MDLVNLKTMILRQNQIEDLQDGSINFMRFNHYYRKNASPRMFEIIKHY